MAGQCLAEQDLPCLLTHRFIQQRFGVAAGSRTQSGRSPGFAGRCLHTHGSLVTGAGCCAHVVGGLVLNHCGHRGLCPTWVCWDGGHQAGSKVRGLPSLACRGTDTCHLRLQQQMEMSALLFTVKTTVPLPKQGVHWHC